MLTRCWQLPHNVTWKASQPTFDRSNFIVPKSNKLVFDASKDAASRLQGGLEHPSHSKLAVKTIHSPRRYTKKESRTACRPSAGPNTQIWNKVNSWLNERNHMKTLNELLQWMKWINWVNLVSSMNWMNKLNPNWSRGPSKAPQHTQKRTARRHPDLFSPLHTDLE